MSDSNNQDVNDSGTQQELDLDDLDNFSDTFFGKEVKQDEAKSDEAKVEDSPEDAPPVDDNDDAAESDDTSDDDDQEEAEKPEAEGKKPSRSQQRITELNTKYREAERREQALIARLEALENGSQKTETPAPKADQSPTPADQNDDGSDKYPLGEFDPSYIRDLTKFTIAEAQKEADEVRNRTATEQAQRQQAEALYSEWENKQGPARERYPDYAEKVASLEDVFSGIDPKDGDYLAQTVMQMDKGAEVLYYLADNPDEARSIVKAGGVKAAIALGRLETRFLDQEDTPTPKKKVSQAPTPPPTNKGSAGGRQTVADDTDDLDAFAVKFFSKKK